MPPYRRNRCSTSCAYDFNDLHHASPNEMNVIFFRLNAIMIESHAKRIISWLNELHSFAVIKGKPNDFSKMNVNLFLVNTAVLILFSYDSLTLFFSLIKISAFAKFTRKSNTHTQIERRRWKKGTHCKDQLMTFAQSAVCFTKMSNR